MMAFMTPAQMRAIFFGLLVQDCVIAEEYARTRNWVGLSCGDINSSTVGTIFNSDYLVHREGLEPPTR